MKGRLSAHVLVLNDEPAILEIFRDNLEDSGYRVSTNNKIAESVDDVVEISPDLVILDFLWSGDHRGWNLIQALRADVRTSTLPIVLCTTGGRELSAIAEDLSAMDITVLLKPFDIQDLLDTLCKKLP